MSLKSDNLIIWKYISNVLLQIERKQYLYLFWNEFHIIYKLNKPRSKQSISTWTLLTLILQNLLIRHVKCSINILPLKKKNLRMLLLNWMHNMCTKYCIKALLYWSFCSTSNHKYFMRYYTYFIMLLDNGYRNEM